MRIERRFTSEGQSAYTGIEFRSTVSEIRNPNGSTVFRQADIEVPAELEPGRLRRASRRKYFRKAGIPAIAHPVEEDDVPEWLWRSRRRMTTAIAKLPEGQARGRRDQRQAGLRPAGRHLDLLGLERRLLRSRRGRQGLFRRNAYHAGRQMARRTHRNGSIPACTGPMASTARRRATTMWISRPAS